MRKDIQFGLTIGGLLLAILVIYLAVFTRSARHSQDVSLVQPPASQPSETVSTTAVDVTRTMTPARVDTAVAPATQPAVADTASAARDWSVLLNNGTASATTQPAEALAATDTPAAVTAAAEIAPVAAAAPATHKVVAGESFYTIAKAVYGDSKYFSRLVDANPTVNPGRLRVGMVINVPPLTGAVSSSPKADESAKTAAVDPAKSYRVKPADTLMAIARKVYGDGQAWEKIYDANRDAIGPNPARLKVDMVLRLPEAPTVATAN